jgi:putative CocE/NonD family hydrolase
MTVTRGSMTEPGRPLPRSVRLLRRLSSKDVPVPVCGVTVDYAIGVPAADGSRLLADHYIPAIAEPRPTILVRTPYGRRFPWNGLFGASFAAQGYHVLVQSCRGTGGSDGEFEPFRTEAADGQATVEWLRKQDWFNGELATIGPSYLGFVQWALAADPPPELRAIIVQNSMNHIYPFLYRGGAFALDDAITGATAMVSMEHGIRATASAMIRLLRHYRQVKKSLPLLEACRAALGRPVGFFEKWLTTPDQADEYWAGLRAPLWTDDRALAVSLVSGWDDVCLDQTLLQYGRLRELGREVRLLVGPWTHTTSFDKGWPVVFPDALDWLARHTGEGSTEGGESPVRVFVRGCDEWRSYPGWPPPDSAVQAWYPAESRVLDPVPDRQPSVSLLKYNPEFPTPAVGGQLLSNQLAGPKRNDRLEARADVLVFTSEPLPADLDVIGPVSARVTVRGSTGYFDVFARLCDVDPRGHSLNVCDGLIRHEGAGWAGLTVLMTSTGYRFKVGHRLRLQLSGGAHPRFNRNYGTGEPIATGTRLVPVDLEFRHGTDEGEGEPYSVLYLPVT